ncbi:MAG: 50S ribosomal protein L10 [Bacteroidota bacterium]
MITKAKKKLIQADLVEKFKRVSGFYVVDFKKMKVSDMLRLRRELRKSGVEMKVAKNTLIDRAMKEVGGFPELPDSVLQGESGIIFGYSDPVAPAKILKEQVEKFDKPQLKGAVLDGQFFEGKRLKQLANLPTKKEVYASIVGSLEAPASGIVGSINAVIRDLSSLIEEVAKQKAA